MIYMSEFQLFGIVSSEQFRWIIRSTIVFETHALHRRRSINSYSINLIKLIHCQNITYVLNRSYFFLALGRKQNIYVLLKSVSDRNSLPFEITSYHIKQTIECLSFIGVDVQYVQFRIPFESAIVCTDNVTYIVFSMHYLQRRSYRMFQVLNLCSCSLVLYELWT